MALSLGGPVGLSAPTSNKITLQSSAPASSTGRTRLRVTCQATFGSGAAKPGGRRGVREQSPNRVQALAAPAVERQLPAPAAQTEAEERQQAPHPDAALEQQRRELESLYGLEAAEAAEEQQRQHQLQLAAASSGVLEAVEVEEVVEAAVELWEEATQQNDGQEQLLQQQERQLQSAAASTSGRNEQQAPVAAVQRQPASRSSSGGYVLSTRTARLVTRTRGRAAIVPPAARASSSPGGDAASSAALASWLLDCSSRQSREARHPLSVAVPRANASGTRPGAAVRRLAGAGSMQAQEQASGASGAVQLAAAAVEGLSVETQQDMLVLIETRAALRKGRRTRRLRCGPSDTMSTYMRSLGNTAVLGKEQEARLAAILQKGRALEALAAKLAAQHGTAGAAAAGQVSDAELAQAAGLASAAEVAQRRANQMEAKDLLMQYNVRLVINIAKRYVNNGIDIADLIPEGMVGLSKSIDRFEPSKGFKFSTYAHWWIRQAISRAVCDQARVVRLPAHVCETLYRINRAITTLVEQSDRDDAPGYEEIAAEVGLPVPRVIQYLRLAKLPGGGRDRSQYLNGSSLKEVTFDDLHELDGDELGVGEEESAEAERHYSCVKAVTDLMLSTLPKRERNILRLRYGLLGWTQPLPVTGMEPGVDGDSASMSLGEVAVAYGLSKERIRQIEEKAMRALRKPWRQRLVQELNFGDRLSPSSLSHLASAQSVAAEEGSWP